MTADKKLKLFENELKKLLPNLTIIPTRYGNSEKEKEIWNRYHYNIPPPNKNLKNSQYYHTGKSLIHFTSINALNSILYEKAIRLYNLNNLNDPREFTFANRVFNLEKEIIKDAKSNLYLISFCERGILKNSTNEFNLWRLYGKNGKGVAIVFKIINNPINWRDFHISKIIYGADRRKQFVQLIELMNRLNQSNPKIDVDFGKLFAFHKSKMFEIEKEVRIIFDRRKKRTGLLGKKVSFKDKQIFPIIKPDLLKLIENKDDINYLKLPLYTKKVNDYDIDAPLLKIEQIIIGYNYISEANKIINYLSELCEEKFGYRPKIKQTRLKDFYWDRKIIKNK